MNDTNSGIFSAAELGNRVDSADYDAALESLRVELLNLQFDLRESDFAVVLLLAGDDRPGTIDAARALHEWMDARYIDTNVMIDAPGPEESDRPLLWRYWVNLPPAGRIGLFLGSWPVHAIRLGMDRNLSVLEFDGLLDHVERFERSLALEGTLLLKFWFHLPKSELAARLKDAEKHPEQHWQFEERDWEILRDYDAGLELVERTIRRTNIPLAPWSVIESTDRRYRNLTMARQIAGALQRRLAEGPPAAPTVMLPVEPAGQNLLDRVDLTVSVSDGDYSSRLPALQSRLNEIARAMSIARIASVIVFEGVDAAGKGGTIRRIAAAFPIQDIHIVRIAAPNEVERAHHYLWRFWREVPSRGRTVIFDRSWYGRVLVERVEGFASDAEWGRAYEEINDFESLLDEAGISVIKFWLQIDAEEQLNRFQARAQTPYKKYKLTDEDLRNRSKWDAYHQAAHDMVARTNTAHSPWYVLAADDKHNARLAALETVCERLEAKVASEIGKDWKDRLKLGSFDDEIKKAKKSSKGKKGKKK